MSNDYYFFSAKIEAPNPETDFFLVDSDPLYMKPIEPDDLNADKILLRFAHRVWEIPKEQESLIRPYYSKYYQTEEDKISFHVHDILYEEVFKELAEAHQAYSCYPTLSFRTLIFDKSHHIKFGLPIRYGRVIRNNQAQEVLTALYLSDYIKQIPSIEGLEFFEEYKGYSFPDVEQYSVSYRRFKDTSNLIPLGCYFNQLLNHSKGTAIERLEKSMLFTKHITEDFNQIYAKLKPYGLGIEVHGQNLLVRVDEKGQALRNYVYRDLGYCTIEAKQYQQLSELNDYYALNYKFKLSANNLRSTDYHLWMSYRIFFLGFLVYNLAVFAKRECIDIDIYQWYYDHIQQQSTMSKIYL